MGVTALLFLAFKPRFLHWVSLIFHKFPLTLCHELAHLALHLGRDDCQLFYDDLDSKAENDVEGEADRLSSDMLIPADQWRESGLIGNCSAAAVIAFADTLRIHPAIPAGRI